MSLRSKVIRLAYSKPELRPHLLPLLTKQGMEHATEEARKKYLQEHPKADPKNHTVGGEEKGDEKGGEEGDKKEDGRGKKTVRGLVLGVKPPGIGKLNPKNLQHSEAELKEDPEAVLSAFSKDWDEPPAEFKNNFKRVLAGKGPEEERDLIREFSSNASDLEKIWMSNILHQQNRDELSKIPVGGQFSQVFTNAAKGYLLTERPDILQDLEEHFNGNPDPKAKGIKGWWEGKTKKGGEMASARAKRLAELRAQRAAKEKYPWDQCIKDKKADPKVDDPEALCAWIKNKSQGKSAALSQLHTVVIAQAKKGLEAAKKEVQTLDDDSLEYKLDTAIEQMRNAATSLKSDVRVLEHYTESLDISKYLRLFQELPGNLNDVAYWLGYVAYVAKIKPDYGVKVASFKPGCSEDAEILKK